MNKSKNILFVIPSLAGGGAERVLVSLVARLTPSQFKPEVITFYPDNIFKGELPSYISVKTMSAGHSFLAKLRLFLQLIWAFKKKRFDLICSHLSYANWITTLAWLVAGKPCPLVITQHNLPTFTSQTAPRPSLQRFLIRTLYPRATKIVAVCQAVKEDLVARFKINPGKITVIYNGIDQDRVRTLAQQDLVLQENQVSVKQDPLIITVGRFSAQKNQELLLRAFKQVKTSLLKAQLIILGEGEKKQELIDLARQLGISDSVHFLNFQPNPFSFITQSDVLVLSSAWEGFPLVILEAMVCGTPVVAANCPSGIPELITHQQNGWLVPAGDDQKMAEAIINLLENKNLSTCLANQAAGDVEKHNLTNMVKNYSQLFSAIITTQGTRRR
jgi:glycosyltransferase involved in cell wall biosynthesis